MFTAANLARASKPAKTEKQLGVRNEKSYSLLSTFYSL